MQYLKQGFKKCDDVTCNAAWQLWNHSTVVGQSARFDHILRPAADGAGGVWHLKIRHWLAEVPHILSMFLIQQDLD